MPSIYISKQSGSWSDVNTWSVVNNASVGQTSTFTMSASSLSPVANAVIAPQSLAWDKIIIAPGHVVEYDTTGSFGDGGSTYLLATVGTSASVFNQLSANAIYLSGGTLKVSRLSSTALTAIGSIVVGNQGNLDWGNSLDPVSAVNTTITLSGRWVYNAAIYTVNTSSNAETYWNRLTFWGLNKTRNTTILNTLSTSSASAVFVSSATNWLTGDTLVLQSYNQDPVNSNIVTITGLTGNYITFTPPINASTVYTRRTAGFRISNLSSNVNVNSISVSNPQMGLHAYLNYGSQALYEFGYFTLENLGNNNAWLAALPSGNTNGNTGSTIAALSVVTGNTSKGVIIESPAIYLKHLSYSAAGGRAGIYFNGWNAFRHVVNNLAFYDLQNAGGTSYGIYNNTGAYTRINNACIYRVSHGIMHNNFCLENSIYNSYICGSSSAMGNIINGLKIYVENSELRSNSIPIVFDGVQDFKLVNCSIGGNTTSGGVILGNDKAAGTVIASNTTLLSGTPFLQAGISNIYANSASVSFYQLSGNRLDYRTYNTNYNGTLDFSTRKNGVRSLKLRLDKSAGIIPFYKNFTGYEGVPQTIKGNVRFDSTYGLTPITVSVEGAGVSLLSSIGTSPDTWYPIEFNFTPTLNSDMVLTFTMYTTATVRTSNVWLDGFLIDPFVNEVRHYGYVFDSLFDRTINSLNTLSESLVSALGAVTNLDYLYDASSYWSTTNPGVSSYTDLFTANGSTLDFGSKNFIINNFGSGFSYLSATNTIILDAPSLSAGNNFNTLKTTGTITLSTGVISNIDVNASIIQNTPTNLTGVYMLNASSTLTYNTNSQIEIEYTDCNIYGVKNDGNAIVTIKKSGITSVTESGLSANDLEIVTYIPTLINLTLSQGYVALYDNAAIRRYYQNTDSTIVLPASATGTWTYRVARYGDELFSGSFNVNPNTGGTIDINPSYVTDNFITQSAVSAVSAYDNLDSTAKIHDYISYIRTTSDGIDYGPLHTQSFGTLSFNYGLTLDATAASTFSFNGSAITLKSTAVADDLVYFIDGDFTQSNGNTLSDGIKVRADNLNSEFYFANVDSLIFYPTENDKNNNTNPGITITDQTTIYRFLYGGYTNGVTLSGNSYIRVTVAGTTLLNSTPINLGSNSIDFGDTGNIQVILNNQKIINQGVQKASKLIPHSTNI